MPRWTSTPSPCRGTSSAPRGTRCSGRTGTGSQTGTSPPPGPATAPAGTPARPRQSPHTGSIRPIAYALYDTNHPAPTAVSSGRTSAARACIEFTGTDGYSVHVAHLPQLADVEPGSSAGTAGHVQARGRQPEEPGERGGRRLPAGEQEADHRVAEGHPGVALAQLARHEPRQKGAKRSGLPFRLWL
ncbi:Cytochrome P450 86A2 [Hordeum vulgare]|nr:Cytochrome P450 86A2 [Hordeum vulgare]